MAVQYLNKAATIDPEYSDVWRKLGIAQYELDGNVNKTFNYYLKAIIINLGDEDSYSYIHYVLSNYDGADAKIVMYNELLKINPKRPDVYMQLGLIYRKEKKDISTSITYFKQYLNILCVPNC